MNIKKNILLLCSFSMMVIPMHLKSQERAISTSMSYLLTRPDARSSAMGDVGAATTADASSLYANPSKIAFAAHEIEAGLSYVPLMRNLVKDVSLLNFSGFKKLNEKSSVGLSIYYLSYGRVDLTDNNGMFIQAYYPAEYTIDFTYARKMSNNFSLALSGRYLQTNTRFDKPSNDLVADPAGAFAADVSMYYIKPVSSSNEAQWTFGAVISNIGTKLQYHNSDAGFLPTNLKLGAAYSFQMNKGPQKLTIAMDINKLLVPTPPIYDGNGAIIDGKDSDRSVISAIFSSFGDAPGGFSEELKEISIGTGLELLYQETFAIRTGFFYENPQKGNRQHFALGTGLKYKNFNFDLGYVIPTANRYVLKNNMKLSLGMHFK